MPTKQPTKEQKIINADVSVLLGLLADEKLLDALNLYPDEKLFLILKWKKKLRLIDIAKEIKLSKSATSRKYTRIIKKLTERITCATTEYVGYSDLKEKNIILEEENRTFRNTLPKNYIKGIEEAAKISIESLDLSTRGYNALIAENIITVADLLTWTKKDLLKIRCFGIHCFVELEQTLKSRHKIKLPE